MEMKLPIDMIDKMHKCVCPKWSTDDQVGHQLKRGTGALEEAGLSVEEWFWTESLQTQQGCVNVLRVIM